MGVYQGVLRGLFASGSQTVNVFTYSAGEHAEEDIITAINVNVNAILLAMVDVVSNQWHATSVDTYKFVAGHWLPLTSVDASGVGAIGGDMLPQTSAFLITGKTRTPHTVGKKYFPGVPESEQASGAITEAAADLLFLVGVIYATPDGGTVELKGGTFNEVTAVFSEFAGFRVSPWVASQRRRRQGRGV